MFSDSSDKSKLSQGQTNNFFSFKPANPDKIEEEPLFTKTYLSYVLKRADVELVEYGKLHIKLLIDNNSDCDWPEKLHLKGKCELTGHVDYVIEKSIRQYSMKPIKFSFEFDQTQFKQEELTGRRLVFAFEKVDEETGVSYCSKTMEVEIKRPEKKGLLRCCGFFV